MTKTIPSVIEEHRVAVGASKVHVSLGPEATAEDLAVELDKLKNIVSTYSAFSELEQERAKVARLRDTIRDIATLAQMNAVEFSSPHTDVYKLKQKLFSLTDMIPDIDLEVDIAWMQAQRNK